MSVSFCVCPGLWYPELVAPSIFISVGRQTESRHHSNRNPPSVCEKPKEHQNSPHSVLSLCLALAKSRQLLSGSARCSWVVCPRDGVPSSHTTRRSHLNGSDRHIILPALSNDRSREASNIHAPATNYGGGMEVSGLRDVSVCHDGPYRRYAVYETRCVRKGDIWSPGQGRTARARTVHRDPVVPVSSTSRHRERPLGHCCRAWPFRALAESAFPWPAFLSTFSRKGVCRTLRERVRVKLFTGKLLV